jgi:hypothetical protein
MAEGLVKVIAAFGEWAEKSDPWIESITGLKNGFELLAVAIGFTLFTAIGRTIAQLGLLVSGTAWRALVGVLGALGLMGAASAVAVGGIGAGAYVAGGAVAEGMGHPGENSLSDQAITKGAGTLGGWIKDKVTGGWQRVKEWFGGAKEAPGTGSQKSDAMAPAGTPAINQGTTAITSNSGRQFRVATQFAENFRGFINDYEKAGGVIGPNSGGLSERPGNASYHPLGRAIDINQIGRDRRLGGVSLPIEMENALAEKWGLRPGSKFSNPDAGHFEVNSALNAFNALKQQGLLSADAKPPEAEPLDKRTLANFLGA